MDLADIPLFSMLRGRLGYLSQRQKLIAQNVANSDTPGFVPKDLKPFALPPGVASADGAQMVAPMRTAAGHMGLDGQTAQSGMQTYASADAPDSETTLDGNRVVLEDQMMKMTEARMDYDAAVSLYQQSLGLLRMAIRRPGG